MEKLFENIHKPNQRKFLAAYSEMGNITRATEEADISRQTHYNWMSQDPEYAEAFKKAERLAADKLEEEARRRAVEGIEEPVYQGGELVGSKMKYSDTLLIFLLKGNKPDKFADRQKVEQENTGEMTIRFVDEEDED